MRKKVIFGYVLMVVFFPIVTCMSQDSENDFPFYNDVICLDLSEGIHLTADEGGFSIYYKTKILYYSDFDKKGLAIPDSIPNWVKKNRTDDLILTSETCKNSYSFNGQQFILVESQKLGKRKPHLRNSFLPKTDFIITEEDVEALIPDEIEWQDYLLTDLNNDGSPDLVVYSLEQDGEGQERGYIEIFEFCNSGFCSKQIFLGTYTNIHHFSYLTFEGHPPVIFVGGESYVDNKTHSSYYFFIVNESLSKKTADLSNCESFIKQEPYQFIKD